MPCFYPVPAYQVGSGELVFKHRRSVVGSLELPCGRCIGCRLEYSRQWAVRAMHEASMHDANCFVTLTYSPAEQAVGSSNVFDVVSLDYRHVQLFLKRVRARFSCVRIRFMFAGEYGDLGRPHYHGLLFGLDFPDKLYWSRSPSGERLYRSSILESLWPQGFSSVGAVTFESAAYVARYCLKKVTGSSADKHYEVIDADGVVTRRTPEFLRCSLKPGIGAAWFEKFWTSDLDSAGAVVVNGQKAKAPRYYDKLYERWDPEGAEGMKLNRKLQAPVESERSKARRVAKEQVTRARLAFRKKTLQ